jgi:predicted DNA-binding transcriptional regulator YafY
VAVVIKIRASDHRYLGEQKYYQGLVEERFQGEWVELEFRTRSLSHFGYWFLSFADIALVVSPESLKLQLRGRVNNMLQNLETP